MKSQNISTEEILKKGTGIFLKINNVKTIEMYYHNWEMDSISWVLEDGRIFGTNHNSLCLITKEEFSKYRNDLKQYLKSIEKF